MGAGVERGTILSQGQIYGRELAFEVMNEASVSEQNRAMEPDQPTGVTFLRPER